MKSETLNQNLNAIRDYISGINGLKESSEVQLIKSQLHVIEKSIRQFEKEGIQVPEGLRSDEISLKSKIKEIGKGPNEMSLLYEALLDIVAQTGSMINRNPVRDLRNRSKEKKQKTIRGDILRSTIIAILEEMGTTGREHEILKSIEERLHGQFTPVDLEPSGRRKRWESNARSERNRMIKEGILTPDSRGKKWTLIK